MVNEDGVAIPNPGSAKAVALGCTCPVMDNHHGDGIPTEDGPEFWLTEGCPLHDKEGMGE